MYQYAYFGIGFWEQERVGDSSFRNSVLLFRETKDDNKIFIVLSVLRIQGIPGNITL